MILTQTLTLDCQNIITSIQIVAYYVTIKSQLIDPLAFYQYNYIKRDIPSRHPAVQCSVQGCSAVRCVMWYAAQYTLQRYSHTTVTRSHSCPKKLRERLECICFVLFVYLCLLRRFSSAFYSILKISILFY